MGAMAEVVTPAAGAVAAAPAPIPAPNRPKMTSPSVSTARTCTGGTGATSAPARSGRLVHEPGGEVCGQVVGCTSSPGGTPKEVPSIAGTNDDGLAFQCLWVRRSHGNSQKFAEVRAEAQGQEKLEVWEQVARCTLSKVVLWCSADCISATRVVRWILCSRTPRAASPAHRGSRQRGVQRGREGLRRDR